LPSTGSDFCIPYRRATFCRGPHVPAVNDQHVERHVDRLPPAEQQVVEPWPAVPVEGHDLAVEHEPWGQGVEQALEPPPPVVVLREHPPIDGVGQPRKPSSFNSNSQAGSSNGSWRMMGMIDRIAAN
jgi:hypothetical protein